MLILIAQSNLVGFLTAVYYSCYNYKNAAMIANDISQATLLDEYIEIDENIELAKRVRDGIIKKGGIDFYEKITDAYRSGQKNKENIIFQYLKLFFKYGNKVTAMFDKSEVIAFNDTVHKVWHEIHRLSAFVRLQEMSNGIYYAYFASDNDILERILPQLIPRFNTQRIILHDYKRQKMGYYDGNDYHYALAPKDLEIELSEREAMFQSLWKQYYNNVTIKERNNEKLFNQFLPKRYRHFMNEF